MTINLPQFVCRFDNYTQSSEPIGLLIYVLAMFGIIGILWWLLGFRTGGKNE